MNAQTRVGCLYSFVVVIVQDGIRSVRLPKMMLVPELTCAETKPSVYRGDFQILRNDGWRKQYKKAEKETSAHSMKIA